MARLRELVARLLVLVAILAGIAALATWWSSFLVVKNAAAINRVAALGALHQVVSQVHHAAPSVPIDPDVDKAILHSLNSTRLLDELSLSAQRGTRSLTALLDKVDPRLRGPLAAHPLHVTVSRTNVAQIAAELRRVAKIALEVGIAAAAAGLLVAPMRHLVLRRVGVAATVVCGLSAALTWGIPNLVLRYAHGTAHHDAMTVLSDCQPVRLVVLYCLIGGAAAFLVTHVFELFGGRRVVYQRSARPLARQKAV